MKKLIFTGTGMLMLVTLLMGSVWAQKPKPEMKKTTTGMAMGDLPYKATYSSEFQIGNPEYGKIILNMWKDWDDNMFDRHSGAFADTVSINLPNGQVIKGRDSVIAGAKKHRGSMASAKSVVHAWIPLKSIDKNENWVAIWGTEEDSWKDGKKTSTSYHEIWRFNKDGKIDLMMQFEAKPGPPQ